MKLAEAVFVATAVQGKDSLGYQKYYRPGFWSLKLNSPSKHKFHQFQSSNDSILPMETYVMKWT